MPHDASAWLPLPALDALPPIEDLFLDVVDLTVEEIVAWPSPARAMPYDPDAWFPLSALDALPPIEDLLIEPLRWEGDELVEVVVLPSPARAMPHDPDAWLPLPEPSSLPSIEELLEPEAVPAGAPSRELLGGVSRRNLLALVIVATVLAGAGFVPGAIGSRTSIELRDGARRIRVSTNARTVGEVLAERHVRLHAGDLVVPAPATRVTDGTRINLLRAFDVVVDVDGSVRTVRTTQTASERFIDSLELGPGLQVQEAPPTLGSGSLVRIRTLRTGILLVDGQIVSFSEPVHTVGELLERFSVVLNGDDSVRPGVDEVLFDGVVVSVTRLGTQTDVVVESYTLPTEEIRDPTLPVGQTIVDDAGRAGLANATYRVVMLNGTEQSRVLLSRVPVRGSEARPMRVRIGTLADPRWDKIAQCETGGNWSAPGPEWQGGLGIWFENWNAYGGREFAPTAGKATREQQIIVAERIRQDMIAKGNGNGWGAWGCGRMLGYDRDGSS
jgi:resuscitation-promoting factor RpfB